ncbi:hypothetical protein [Candidatus Nitrospira allomarina]|uniref:Uncharacterized protein n=1 Tax=Candidatus Nitrospira allomarina TaxID=3020900 RepID=A0AA96JSE2_9BACT|nr:hypothetical protein [Candidatus Nitrospira allomarina]WNM58467.1 hypothetical protein PP769_01510 [Candidatus Nitrospira allomarina]
MISVWGPDSQNYSPENPFILVKSEEKLDGINSESLHPVSILVVDDRVYCRCPPAVMVTGNLTNSVRTRATHAGALAVLSKLFVQGKIPNMVREVLHRKQEAHH